MVKPRRTGRIALLALGVVAAAVVVYTVFGLLAGRYFVERALESYEADVPGRSISVERVRVNPYRLSVTLKGLEMIDPSMRTTWTVAFLTADFRLRSLLERRAVIAWLALEQPYVELGRPEPGDPRTPGLPVARMASPLLALTSLRVDRLNLVDGGIGLDLGDGGHAQLSDVALVAEGIDTEASDGVASYALEAGDAMGARLELGGLLRLRASHLAGSAVEIFDSRGRARDVNWPLLPGVAVRTPLVEADVTARLDRGHGSGGASAWLHSPAVTLRDAGRTALTLTDAVGALAAGYPDSPGMALTLQGGLAPGGRAVISTGRDAGQSGSNGAVTLQVSGLPATALTGYSRRVFGRAPTAGRLELWLDAEPAGEHRAGTLVVAAFDLALAGADAERSPDDQADDGFDLDLDLDLALALLTDASGGLAFSVPVIAEATAPIADAMVARLRNHVAMLTASPFGTLARALDPPAPLVEQVAFAPGSAALDDATRAELATLADALTQRPGLALAIPAAIHPTLDRDALARRQVELHVSLAIAGPTARTRPVPMDFESPRVTDILDEFAGERLDADELAAIGAHHDRERNAGERARYFEAVFDALVENESIGRATLERMGRFRARSIADTLAANGVGAERIEVPDEVTMVSDAPGDSKVAVRLALTARSAR